MRSLCLPGGLVRSAARMRGDLVPVIPERGREAYGTKWRFGNLGADSTGIALCES